MRSLTVSDVTKVVRDLLDNDGPIGEIVDEDGKPGWVEFIPPNMLRVRFCGNIEYDSKTGIGSVGPAFNIIVTEAD